MGLVNRQRTLRPSSRAAGSPYKVKTQGLAADDVLRLTLREETAPNSIVAIFNFRGCDVSGRRSIHFSAARTGGSWTITFLEAKPSSATI